MINWNNFYVGSIIKNGKTGKRNVDGGIIIVETDFTLGSVRKEGK